MADLMEIEGKVSSGEAVFSEGTDVRATFDPSGGLRVSQNYARYQNRVLAGNCYIGANPAGTAVTTQAGLSATTPALTLWNPVGSGVNLVLLACQYIVTAAPAAAAGFMLAYNAVGAAAPATTTAVTPINCLIGNTSVGKAACYRVATLAAAPVAFRYLGGTTGAAAISGYPTVDYIDGSCIVVPGCAISIQTTSAAAILAAFVWEEVKL